MPALPLASLPYSLINRDAIANSSNTTNDALQVVCVFTISGQYGPGTRVLYYCLVAACIFARRVEWLRDACLAAALLFPAVAALHGIVLAAVHINGVIDMDIYGAFQLCAIGIVAAPITVTMSNTYFYTTRRNTIFLWTAVVLAGLLSLTVEFYRSATIPCTQDGFGNPISPNINLFPYGNATCGLTCSTNDGPFSPIRQGSADNIFVIPAPTKFTFGTGTLLAAACCIPAILSLVSMWVKILQINWKSRFGEEYEDENANMAINGTNGATVAKMKRVNGVIKGFLSVLGTPLVGAALLALIIIGERNFFSIQVNYQTEPITSVGQWAPIVGTGIAVLGSLYLLLASGKDKKTEKSSNASTHQCDCSHCRNGCHGGQRLPDQPDARDPLSSRDSVSIDGDYESSPQSPTNFPATQEIGAGVGTASPRSATSPDTTNLSNSHRRTSTNLARTTTSQTNSTGKDDRGYRRKVAHTLTNISNYFGTASRDRFDDSEFQHGAGRDFPEIPGEEHRNRDLQQIRSQYNRNWEADRNDSTALRREHSRTGSYAASIASGRDIEGSPTRSPSPRPPLSRQSQPSTSRILHASTFPTQRPSIELQNHPIPSSTVSSERAPTRRRDTLEVPSPVHLSHTRSNSGSTSSMAHIVTIPTSHTSPRIVVSSDPAPSPPTDEEL